jgi:hypothetical protein
MSSNDGALIAEIKNEEISFMTTTKNSFEKMFLNRLVKCI